MKYLNTEEIEQLKRTPVKRSRVNSKTDFVRDHESWFKKMHQYAGVCDNPECIDPRPKSQYPVTMVAKVKSDIAVCRFCYLAGYGTG